jgi:hypothetical protein
VSDTISHHKEHTMDDVKMDTAQGHTSPSTVADVEKISIEDTLGTKRGVTHESQGTSDELLVRPPACCIKDATGPRHQRSLGTVIKIQGTHTTGQCGGSGQSPFSLPSED